MLLLEERQRKWLTEQTHRYTRTCCFSLQGFAWEYLGIQQLGILAIFKTLRVEWSDLKFFLKHIAGR